jgi:hypothetical protein
MTLPAIIAQLVRADRQRTLRSAKTAALDALNTHRFVRHDAIIHETALDFVPNVPTEHGFVVQTYTCGTLRDAYFFTGRYRVPLSGDEIETVLTAASTCTTVDSQHVTP